MADISIHFNCKTGDGSYIETFLAVAKTDDDESICVSINSKESYPLTVYLDKSTAIKLAKTIRTEINKMED